MIRIFIFLLLISPLAHAQTRCDTLAHDIVIHRQINLIQSRTITDLQKQVGDLKQRAVLSNLAITDLETRANADLARIRQQYAGWTPPQTRWQRLKKNVGTFAAGAGTGMILLLILR